MTEVIELIRIDFDSMENHDPIVEASLGVFVSNDKTNAHKQVDDFVRSIDNKGFYLGYNQQVYPQFKVIRKHVR